MITGGCPYCSEIVFNTMPDKTPAYSIQFCNSCNKDYWMLHSRLESIAYTIEAFNKEYIVDYKNKTIIKRSV